MAKMKRVNNDHIKEFTKSYLRKRNYKPVIPVASSHPVTVTRSPVQVVDQPTTKETLLDIISKVNQTPPCLPEVCSYSIKSTHHLASAVVNDNFIVAGLEDSSIRCWNRLYHQKLCQSYSKRSISEIELGCHPDADEDASEKEADRPEESGSSQSPEGRPEASSAKIHTLRGHGGPVYGLAFYPYSNILFSCSDDMTIRAWDTTTSDCVAIYQGHSKPIWSLDCFIVGDRFVSGSKDTTAHLWCSDRTFPLRTFCGHTADVNCVKFFPNGYYFATGSSDKSVRFWNVEDARMMRVFSHRAAVYCLDFSPDGKYLVSAGLDRVVKVWDLRTSKVFKEFHGHNDLITDVSFNECSSVISSCSLDRTLKLWTVDTVKDLSVSSDHSSGDRSQNPPDLLATYNLKLSSVIFGKYQAKDILFCIGTE